ncbi:hypothetical protein ACWEOI_32995 [Nocardia sp. NPDC004340]
MQHTEPPRGLPERNAPSPSEDFPGTTPSPSQDFPGATPNRRQGFLGAAHRARGKNSSGGAPTPAENFPSQRAEHDESRKAARWERA